MRVACRYLACYDAFMTSEERILVIDQDEAARELLMYETLQPAGYAVVAVDSAASALEMLGEFPPDLLITDLQTSGFSGKDLITALKAQGVDAPVIVLVEDGNEQSALDAFRLGAVDYLTKPLREAEVVAAVDRAMQSIRIQRESTAMAGKLQLANTSLEKRVRELTTLIGVAKSITNLNNVEALFNRLVSAGLYVTNADVGWLLLLDDKTGELRYETSQNLPDDLPKKFVPQRGAKWHAGMSPMIMLSGQPLMLHGSRLEKFLLGRFAKTALVVPIMVKDQPVGTIVMARHEDQPFGDRDKTMLAAVADYASAAVVNIRLFQALELRAEKLDMLNQEIISGEKGRDDMLIRLGEILDKPVKKALSGIESLAQGDLGDLTDDQTQALSTVWEHLGLADELIDTLRAGTSQIIEQ